MSKWGKLGQVCVYLCVSRMMGIAYLTDLWFLESDLGFIVLYASFKSLVKIFVIDYNYEVSEFP